jgi:predicted amidohydrolase
MAQPSQFTVAVAQINPRLGDVAANLELYSEQMRAARGLGADVVVFPELSLSGYFLKDMVATWPCVSTRRR